MEKKVRNFKIDYPLDWVFGVEISKLRADLDAIEALGATYIDIDIDDDYGYCLVKIEPISKRLETDEEFNARVKEEEKRQFEIKRRELEQLERLKLKYGL